MIISFLHCANICDIAADIVDKVIINKASWADLFAKHDFFRKYRHYLQAIASTGNRELQIKWYVYIQCLGCR